MNWKKLSIFLTCLSVVFACKNQDDDSGVFSSHSSHSLPIEHAFGLDAKFSPRGKIMFKTSRVITASFKETVLLSDEELENLQNLVKEDGLYFIRAPAKIDGTVKDDVDITEPTRYVSTFVPACYLYGSSLTEIIKISVDNTGNVISLSVVSPRHDCSLARKNSIYHPEFNSTVLINQQACIYILITFTFLRLQFISFFLDS